MDAEKLNQELYDKMAAEQNEYRSWLMKQKPEEILNHVFEYSAREDILLGISVLALPAQQAAALLTSPSPLADIYKDFRNMETNQMNVVADCIQERATKLLEAQWEATRTIPLYQQSGGYAREHGELDTFRASRQANVACKEAIEAAIQAGYDGMHLTADAKGVLAEFGPERVAYVLAATIQVKDWDERFSRRNKAWAAAVPMFEQEERRGSYIINSHSTLLDGFVDMMREEIADLSGLIANPHLYSTVHVTLVDGTDGEVIEALYDYAGQYQEVISRSMEAFHAAGYPDNDLMRQFKLPDNPKMERSIRGKIQSAHVTVEASGPLLYARLDLKMNADLTCDELDAFTGQIEAQYRNGWGAEFELLTIPAGNNAVGLRLWNDDITFFTAAEKDGFELRTQQSRTELDTIPVQREEYPQAQTQKSSIKAKLAAAKAAQAEKPAAQQRQKDKGAR